MLTGGHIAVSYLLTESAKSLGIPLTYTEVIQIIIAGNIVDLDLLMGFFNGKSGEAHHQNISHTPFGNLLIWFIFILIFYPSLAISILILFAMVIHMILDDIGYWAYKLRFIKSPVNPQINWLYPFVDFHKFNLIKNNKNALKYYIFNTWQIAFCELFLIITALVIFTI